MSVAEQVRALIAKQAEKLQRVGEVIRYVETRVHPKILATERVSGVGTPTQAEESSD